MLQKCEMDGAEVMEVLEEYYAHYLQPHLRKLREISDTRYDGREKLKRRLKEHCCDKLFVKKNLRTFFENLRLKVPKYRGHMNPQMNFPAQGPSLMGYEYTNFYQFANRPVN